MYVMCTYNKTLVKGKYFLRVLGFLYLFQHVTFMIFIIFIECGHLDHDLVEEFSGEIEMLKRVGRHKNIVRLLGVCTREQPLMMIMEYVPCGDLVRINND
jgi:serine/threonine protein kinase